MTESQLNCSDFNAQTKGNLSLWVPAVNIQMVELRVPLEGHISSTVIFPLIVKLKTSYKASADVVEEALIESCTVHKRPTTFISCPNILVFLDIIASWERRM